jgi:hypothetical protein
MTATAIMANLFTFLSGPFGAGIIAVVVLIAFIRLSAEHSMRHLSYAVLGGAGFYSVAWVLAQVFGGGATV